MRRKILSICIVCLCLLFLALYHIVEEPLSGQVFEYYQQHFFIDTGALNAVTAIYLNYRVFDTLFETLMLLVSVIGIIYFSRHEGGHHHE